MAKASIFNEKQIKEINDIIEQITGKLQKDCEIAACNKVMLASMLSARKIEKTIKSVACRPEYSNAIVSYFVKEKGVALSQFNRNLQSTICIIY
jgi:hypothetical protein